MKLGIYGAGGLGREVFELVKSINHKFNRWNEVFFIDDAADTISNPAGLQVNCFKDVLNKTELSEVEICIAVGEPSIRLMLSERILNSQLRLATLIHPEIVIPSSTIIGSGSIICNFSSVSCDVNIGSNVYIHPMTVIGHDVTVGSHSVISSFVDIGGNSKVGENVYLALNVMVKQGVNIDSGTIVGMASVVNSNLPSNVIALGNPARPMRRNDEQRVFK
jgi:sugar O-acyltransferase (sialic acid O-acetyltransferase NeuD family)